ncbi:SAM-dependent methyltransferase [Leptobacterium sp. I13]|uniref:SAM-dependent methyltransferase n=1 Tax=Leptobacterium meishanense TaxID=3128904 RepID=UPI0030EE6827
MLDNNDHGSLYLIPITIGDNEPLEVLPVSTKAIIEKIDEYIVESEKAARRFIKKMSSGKPQSNIQFHILNKYTDDVELEKYLTSCIQGQNIALMSDAGCPGVADPGANIVALAHQKGIRVIPLVGPSSIIMALMSSGLNGQNFTFNGYLPIDKKERQKELKKLEKRSKELNQSQIFIETPYRNDRLMEDLVNYLNPNTLLCIACDITLITEHVKTKPISEWKLYGSQELNKRPCVFIIQTPVKNEPHHN